MILGRPTNLILGAITALFNLVILVLAALEPPIIIPAVVVGAANLAIGAVIALIANQPPTVNPGSTINVVTPASAPNQTQTVSVQAIPVTSPTVPPQ